MLAVETQKGTAMYGVRAQGPAGAAGSLPEDTSVNADELDVLIDRGDKNVARNVVYSVPLSSAADLKKLKGDQMVVEAKLEIEEKLPQAPDIANYIVLSDKPDSIRGRYLLSDSYDPNKTGNNGENCVSSCEFVRPAAVTTILEMRRPGRPPFHQRRGRRLPRRRQARGESRSARRVPEGRRVLRRRHHERRAERRQLQPVRRAHAEGQGPSMPTHVPAHRHGQLLEAAARLDEQGVD